MNRMGNKLYKAGQLLTIAIRNNIRVVVQVRKRKSLQNIDICEYCYRKNNRYECEDFSELYRTCRENIPRTCYLKIIKYIDQQ